MLHQVSGAHAKPRVPSEFCPTAPPRTLACVYVRSSARLIARAPSPLLSHVPSTLRILPAALDSCSRQGKMLVENFSVKSPNVKYTDDFIESTYT